MNLIPNYQDLNILERIVFWGKTIVIILLIMLAVILIIKKRKQRKKTIETDFEELPILKDEIDNIETTIKEEKNEQEELKLESEETKNLNILENTIESSEEITETNQEIEVNEEIKKQDEIYNTSFEIPSAPYQRNVLREMSLSQTSPIGINRKEEPINIEELVPKFKEMPTIEEQKKELSDLINNNLEYKEIEEQEILGMNNTLLEEEIEEQEENDYDIERTSYEIEQEENAIISYKELMEKKDSIQTIDEEEAIISIEELLNKTNSKKAENKLYNITEEEENDSFINELKQFRKDL